MMAAEQKQRGRSCCGGAQREPRSRRQLSAARGCREQHPNSTAWATGLRGRGQAGSRGRRTGATAAPSSEGQSWCQLTVDWLLVHGVDEVPGVFDCVLEIPDGVRARPLTPHPLLGTLGLLLQLRQPALLGAARTGRVGIRTGQVGMRTGPGQAGRCQFLHVPSPGTSIFQALLWML